jgi:hypothetical protein
MEIRFQKVKNELQGKEYVTSRKQAVGKEKSE